MNRQNKMKMLLLAAGLVLAVQPSVAQNHHDLANYSRYAEANASLGRPAKGEKRVVLFGNSITDGWPNARPEFFGGNNLIGRGISGQTSYQFLLRFRQDVIELQPRVVVINYGTNDIAENAGAYSEDITFQNVQSLVDLARANKIKVILASCLPAGGFGWRPGITDSMDRIRRLNARVEAYARENKIPYVDYFGAMVSADGTQMNPDYASDRPGVHPNAKGYEVMEGLLLPIIKKVR